MAKKNADPASDRINEAVDDGSGCVETWEALSEVRESPNPDRRRFLRTVGFSFGALTLGSGVSAASGLEEIGDEDEDLPEIHTEEVRGRKRGQLVSGAVRSSEVRRVADELGGKSRGCRRYGSTPLMRRRGTRCGSAPTTILVR